MAIDKKDKEKNKKTPKRVLKSSLLKLCLQSKYLVELAAVTFVYH